MTLITVRTAANLQKTINQWHKEGLTVGFVPTMGALHDGHLSLIKIALQSADKVVASIFVNPTQFAPHEDFATYPREEQEDLRKLEAAGAHLIYMPPEKEIYPDGATASLKPGRLAQGLESDFRPHFFAGVVTVVHRLFEQVKPDVAVFGEKDFQQLCVIKEMVEERKMPIKIIGAPIARDSKGLALSSRNAYLISEDLGIARKLNKILFDLAEEIRAYPDEADDLIPIAIETLLSSGFDDVDYVEVWNGRLLAAVWIGKTRLIDNVAI